MRLALWMALVGSVGCAAEHLAAPATHLPEPLAAFGRLPSIEEVALSPGGSRIAFVKTTDDNRRAVAIVALADRKVIGTLQAGDTKLRGIEWLDEDHLLLTTSATAVLLGTTGKLREWFMLQVYDVAQHKARPLLNGVLDRTTANVTWGHPMVRRLGGHTVLFAGGYDLTDRSTPGLFRIDVDTGHEEVVRKGSPATRAWLVDDAGEVVAEEDYRDREQSWAFRIRRNGSLDDVATGVDPFDESAILGFGPAGDTLVTDVFENGEVVRKSLSLKDGTWGARTSKVLGRGVVLDRLTDRMIARVETEDDLEYTFLDSALQERWDAIARNFEGERVRLVSMSDDRTKLVVLVDGRRDGYTYELVDAGEHGIEPVGAAYAGLPELSEVRRISYPAADGLQISAYVTLPNGRSPSNLPLVVLPHGGPAARDRAGFDWWAQALASRGYAVLQPNYRGSTVDTRLLSAGFGEWGRKMQTDLSDGVRSLAKEGIVDPARVCIVGGSYGGYAALAGVTLEQGVYRCAVSVAGIADLKRFLRWVKERDGRGHGAAQRWWDRFMGVTGPADPALAAISPIEHVAGVSAPVLLIHGRDDTIVPYEQSTAMAAALEGAGKSVELVALDGEDHWLSRSATRLQMLEHLLAFLAVNDPAD